MTAQEIVAQYYNCFNQKDYKGMFALVDEHIQHDSNQGESRFGKAKFEAFVAATDAAYDEQLTDIVVMSDAGGRRAAAEFTVNGIYKKADAGMPAAHGQSYKLPAGAFLEINENGLITRVTTYYNLPLWIQLVSE